MKRTNVWNTFKLVSRLVSLLMITPSRYACLGLSAHNVALKEYLRQQYSPEEFYQEVLREWKLFKKGLKWLGSKVHVVDPLGGKSCPDCMFAQDLALRLRGLYGDIFVSPKKMGAPARRKEAARLRRLFGRKVKIVTLPGRIDFGDVIAFEINSKRVLLIGIRDNLAYEKIVKSSQKLRTTIRAIKALEKIARSAGYEVIRVKHSALHLTTATTMAGQAKQGEPIVFLHNHMLTDTSITRIAISGALGLRMQDIKFLSTEMATGSKEERAKASWSASCVGHNGKVLIQKGATVAGILRQMGFKVKEVPFDFIRSIDGGMTCLILELIGLKPVRKSWKKKKATSAK